MRRIILLALLLYAAALLSPADAEAQTFVQYCANSAPGGNATCSLPSNVSSNALIVITVSSCGPLGGAPTDTLAISYSQIPSTSWLSMNTSCNFRNHAVNLYWGCSGASSGADTITQLNNGAVGYSPAIIVAEFSGVTCSLDGSGVNNPLLGATTGLQTGGNVSPSTAPNLVIVHSLTSGAANMQQTAGTGYTVIATQNVDWGGNDCGGACTAYQSLEYKVNPASGSYAAQFTFNGVNNNAGIGGQAFGPGIAAAAPSSHSYVINGGAKVH